MQEFQKFFDDEVYDEFERRCLGDKISTLKKITRRRQFVHFQHSPPTARRVNVDSTKLLAEFCTKNNIHLIFISTNYVFDGKKGAPYLESDETCAINDYGNQKAQAEKFAADHTILRISLQYGPHNGHNPSSKSVLDNILSKVF